MNNFTVYIRSKYIYDIIYFDLTKECNFIINNF